MEESNQFNVVPILSFGQAIKNIFSKYATFTGRARRSEFWWFQLFNFILVFVASLLDDLLGLGISDTGEGVISLIVTLALLLPGLSVLWRRLHDINKSGWNYLLVIVPLALCVIFALVQLFVLTILMAIVLVVTAILILVWCCMDSKQEENKYGLSPKYLQVSEDTVEDESVPV
ncbi:MAG: DUF805 domain-containing protein [Prevotella sp.]|jgi:uncharacterized membrane protein YhaH (DUF805 family)|nr:DUF805 domain-containing protein [Prevotella sp.]MCH4181887.1 DUF805 domain-containing protein [Prevotella sp.]MCH4212233.1 DUF805 domain-containing protein [Prevotella sp.]MCH4241486.1 DUF805 domain-containing protein [Prevotella sp.]